MDYTYGEELLPNEILDQIWQEIDLIFPAMKSPEESGAAENKKSGRGFFADSYIAEVAIPKIASLNKFVEHNGKYAVLVNYYDEGDYYKAHTDDSEKTLTVFLSKEPDAFEGGEFVFNDLNVTLPFVNNSYVVFDQGLTHEVTPVHIKKSSGRYSLTYFYY